MKKLLSVLIAVTMLMASFTAVHAGNDIKVLLDGSEITFDVPPQIIESRTFVPMRAIFEALGAEVAWDDTTKTVTSEKGGTFIMMTIGSDMMFVNFSPVILDAPPQIIDGRTLVPVRAVAESFDCEVGWDNDTRTVTIATNAEEGTETTAEEKTETFPISYDDSAERTSSQAKGFKLTSVTPAGDGKYEITYTVDTYRESSGDIIVSFDCLDSAGKKVDRFSQLFFAYAYCWTPQESSAVISDKTAAIILSENQ